MEPASLDLRILAALRCFPASASEGLVCLTGYCVLITRLHSRSPLSSVSWVLEDLGFLTSQQRTPQVALGKVIKDVGLGSRT